MTLDRSNRRRLELSPNKLLDNANTTTRGGEFHGEQWKAELAVATRQKRKVARHRFENQLTAGAAREHLAELPADGEQLHCIMRGNYNAFDLIPAVLQLAGCRCDIACIATLGFNRRNHARLIELLDGGQIARVDPFIVSVFWEAHDRGRLAVQTKEDLEQRGSTYAAVRSHAKVFGLQMADGRAYTIEGSANLSSCRMVEQFSLSCSRDVFEFHRSWMREMQRAAQ